MKSKLRNINVNSTEFKYVINEKFLSEKERCWKTTLKVFKVDCKNTPLEIIFESADGYAVGNMLTSGIAIKNEVFNLHKPSIVKKLIEEGIKKNWNWEESKLEISNGLMLLEEMGYSIESLKI